RCAPRPPIAQQRNLVAVPKTQDPGVDVFSIERGVAPDRDSQRGQVDAYEDAEREAKRGPERALGRAHLFSSARRFLAGARLGSFSSARSSIWTALALSP